jgi:serine/threonine protein kinase
MHKQNICHRDIWPKNILCSKDGNKLKIIDLGVSRRVSPENDNLMLTETGCFAYRAPEIILNEEYK